MDPIIGRYGVDCTDLARGVYPVRRRRGRAPGRLRPPPQPRLRPNPQVHRLRLPAERCNPSRHTLRPGAPQRGMRPVDGATPEPRSCPMLLSPTPPCHSEPRFLGRRICICSFCICSSCICLSPRLRKPKCRSFAPIKGIGAQEDGFCQWFCPSDTTELAESAATVEVGKPALGDADQAVAPNPARMFQSIFGPYGDPSAVCSNGQDGCGRRRRCGGGRPWWRGRCSPCRCSGEA